LFPWFIQRNKDIGIDAAKVPSVIYHEAFHWAADQLGVLPATAFGRPIADAFCNYFAASILGKGVVGGLDSFIDSHRTQRIDQVQFLADNANGRVRNRAKETHSRSSFVPSVFWSLRTKVGASFIDKTVWQTLLELRQDRRFGMLTLATRQAAARTIDDQNALKIIDE